MTRRNYFSHRRNFMLHRELNRTIMLIQLPSIHHSSSDKFSTDYTVHPQTRETEQHRIVNPAFIVKRSFEIFQPPATAESSSVTPAVSYGSTEVIHLSSILPTLQPLQPSLSSTVQISLTVMYIFMFSILFLLVYAQLWMIWYYRHKRLSHQTLFLFMCLIWAGLRTTLFSFYFRDFAAVNNLSIALFCLLNSLPVCMQFCMLCLLLHFILQVRNIFH